MAPFVKVIGGGYVGINVLGVKDQSRRGEAVFGRVSRFFNALLYAHEESRGCVHRTGSGSESAAGTICAELPSRLRAKARCRSHVCSTSCL